MAYRDLKKIDTKLANTSKKISFLIVNPTNIESEKEKFFSKKEYNPQFKYQRYRANLDILKKRLENIPSDDGVFGRILEQDRLEQLKKVLMLRNIGKDEFTACSVDVYGKPTEELVENARNMLTLEENSNDKSLTSEEILEMLHKAFEKYDFQDWTIKEKDMPALAAVKHTKKVLFIKKDTLFSKEIIDRLIVHEIGTHLLRFKNGESQRFKILRRGLPGYMATEEGLAVINEEIHGHLNKRIMRNYVGRVVAIDIASRGSFMDVYNELSKHFIAENAFKLALRAKRGISDTSKPGGLTKDYLYLEGYFKVKEYLNKGGKLKDLYHGRIGVEHISLLSEIPYLKKPQFFMQDGKKPVIRKA